MTGITTWAVPGKAVYLRENDTGRQCPIGLYDVLHPEPENKMQPVFYGFAALGIPALKRCAGAEAEWITIDEIGYVECACREYCQELLKLFENKRVIVSVRKQNLPFLTELRSRGDVFVVDLDRPVLDLGCVIMASGLGKRFGGNKLMTPFHGRPMAEQILDTTEGIFSRRVVVTRHEDVAALCRCRGIEAVLHALPHRNDTVRLGMKALGDVPGVMFCPADQPLITQESIRMLALCAANTPDTIWRTRCGTEVGAPIVFPRRFFPELLTLPESKGGGYVVKAHPDTVRFFEVADSMELRDVDTPEDLQQLENV